MWDIFQAVIATGDTLPFAPGFPRSTFDEHWLGAQSAWVAVSGNGVLGMYKMGANYPGYGSHVCSATYLVNPPAQGNGIGRALVEHSLAVATEREFVAMQFNFVVSTNALAVKLYKKLGFEIVGTLPRAFRHREFGLVDAHVMYRPLDDQPYPRGRPSSTS